MFKRMSVLGRRSSDNRDQFARGWASHGRLVAQLKNVRGYLQNHIIEEIVPGTLRADGLVELWFDSPAAMSEAFAGPGAFTVAADEINFLGHATGYALRAASPLRSSPPGAKLICAAAEQEELGDVLRLAASAPGVEVLVDDVVTMIPKAGITLPPQPVARFVHVLLPNAASAQALGATIREATPQTVAIYRVDTLRQV